MRVLVFGAGAGGAATAVELSLAGHEVVLFGRSAATVAPFLTTGIVYDGVIGDGVAHPALVTDNLEEALRNAEVAVVVLPTPAHRWAASVLAAAGWGSERPIILNPGHTGGAMAFTEAMRSSGLQPPPIAEFSTLLYVVRKSAPGRVVITGRAKSIRVAALPGEGHAVEVACELFPGLTVMSDVLATSLTNVNMVLHPPGAILTAAWVEATGGDFTFYGDAMTPGVARVIAGLDAERLQVARIFGHDLPNLVSEMKLIGTVEMEAPDDDIAAAVSGGEANRRIKAPNDHSHRYYTEDFSHGLTPFMAFAGVAGVDIPIATALSGLGRVLAPVDEARDSISMGIAGLDLPGLMSLVRG